MKLYKIRYEYPFPQYILYAAAGDEAEAYLQENFDAPEAVAEWPEQGMTFEPLDGVRGVYRVMKGHYADWTEKDFMGVGA